MKVIASRANPFFKSLIRMHQEAGKLGKSVILEGIHLCQSWLNAGNAPEWVVVDRAVEHTSEIQRLILATAPERLVLLEPGLFKSLSDVVTGQGILFVVSILENPVPVVVNQNCILLDRVQDPGNVGSILRTAAAAGVKLVLASDQTAALWSPKVLRSAQGAHFGLVLHQGVDLLSLLGHLTVPAIATTIDGATDLYRSELPARCAWIFGNEGQGIRAELSKRASLRVRVPLDSNAVESLNVAVCAALCIYEQRRQHQSD